MTSRRFVFVDDENTFNESLKRRRVLRIDDDEEEDDIVETVADKYPDEDIDIDLRHLGKQIGVFGQGKEKQDSDLRPIGEPIEVFHEGTEKTSLYGSLVHNGVHFHLEDTVLLEPEHEQDKPYVGIIKEISKTCKEPLKITVQWLYRREDAAKRGGGTYQPRCTRELLLSFHHDEVHAESIRHACVVHFVPLSKQIPDRKQHPGFVVQYVYDFQESKIYNIEDRDYREAEQHEIDRLLSKTIQELGDLPDVVGPKPDVVVPKPDVVGPRPVQNEHPDSKYNSVLLSYNLLTETRTRNKWLEKLLESVQPICTGMSHNQNDKEEGNSESKWPYKAVSAVAALEKAVDSAFSADPGKYKRKMWQLECNLKNNDLLARRLLNKELEPAQILNMSPEELKMGLIAEEIPSREPEDVGYLQMTEARCTNCSEKQVALMHIFQAGNRNRYQMECQACGKSWQEWMMPQ